VEKAKVVINRVSFRSFFMALPGFESGVGRGSKGDSISIERGNISNGAWFNSEFRDRDILDLGVHMNLNFKIINQGKQKIIYMLCHCPITLSDSLCR
jgi:hypothetical protein